MFCLCCNVLTLPFHLKICNIETYVLTNQCCKVTLVKAMLLTSKVLPPTQRRSVFFHLKYRPLCFLILDSLCGSLSSHLSKCFNQTIFWCPVVLKEEGVAFQSIQWRSRLYYKICFVCVFIYETMSVLLLYIINGWLGVVWRRHGSEVEALKVL